MRKRAVLLAVAVVMVSAVGVIAAGTYRNHEAERHLDEASRRLTASILDAPEIHGIAASSALSHLDRAVAAGVPESRVRILREYAGALVKLQSHDLLAASRALESARASLGRGMGEVAGVRRSGGSVTAADLHVLAGTLSRAVLDADEARLQTDAALRIDPRHPRALLLEADLALDRGDADVARASLEDLVRIVPGSSAVHNRLGLAYERQGDIVAAEGQFRESIRLHRRNADAFVNLGRVLAARRDLGAAAQAYDTAIAIAPADSDAHLGRGLVRLAVGRIVEAREDLERAYELDGQNDAILLALGDLERARGDLDAAVAWYREAVRVDGADAHGWVKLGNALFASGDAERALAAFELAVGFAPELAAAHNGRGAALMRLGRHEGAEAALERAAALDAVDPNPLLNLGLLHERRGARRAAAVAFRRALERDPSSTAARERLSAL